MPLLMFLFAMLLFGGSSQSDFSLHRTSHFSVQRVTENFAVKLPYFVPPKFDTSRSDLDKMERDVHRVYRELCADEIATLRRLMRRDWFGQWHHTPRSKQFDTPYCRALNIDPLQ